MTKLLVVLCLVIAACGGDVSPVYGSDASPPPCEPGALGCEGNRIKTCDIAGTWVTGVLCQHTCTGEGVCTNP